MHTGGIKQVYCCRREPRDASRLSVASIVQCRAQSSVISYFRFRCTAAYKQIQFTALQRHCGNLWHKHTCTVKPGTHCMATKSNSRRSTWLKVTKSTVSLWPSIRPGDKVERAFDIRATKLTVSATMLKLHEY